MKMVCCLSERGTKMDRQTKPQGRSNVGSGGWRPPASGGSLGDQPPRRCCRSGTPRPFPCTERNTRWTAGQQENGATGGEEPGLHSRHTCCAQSCIMLPSHLPLFPPSRPAAPASHRPTACKPSFPLTGGCWASGRHPGGRWVAPQWAASRHRLSEALALWAVSQGTEFLLYI